MAEWWKLASLGGGALLLGLAAWWWPALRARLRGWRREELFSRFLGQREMLQAEFLRAGAALGLPRGLCWKGAEWLPGAWLARDRQSGLYLMLLPAELRFEALEGGDMEDLPAVAQAKQATAVFFFAQGRWQTQGKTVFNLGPEEVLRHFAAQYEPMGAESTA